MRTSFIQIRSTKIALLAFIAAQCNSFALAYRIVSRPLALHGRVRSINPKPAYLPTNLHMQAVSRPYPGTLDDHFIPTAVLTTGAIAKLTVLVIVLLISISFIGSLEINEDFSLVNWLKSIFQAPINTIKNLFRSIGNTFRGDDEDLTGTEEIMDTAPVKTTRPVSTVVDWKPCQLDHKYILNGRFMFYKFKTNNPRLKLGLGRKIILAWQDEDGNRIKEEFFPCSLGLSPGEFGVISRVYKRSRSDKLSTLLPSLTFDDTVAFKEGVNVFQYSVAEDQVRLLTIVASGLGIVPIWEFISKILPDPQTYGIDSCELLWINDSKEDFIFNNEIEKLEEEFSDRFFVARVLDADISYEDTILNDRVRDALPLHEPQRVAIVAAPSGVMGKLTNALESLSYRGKNILKIVV